jgi:pilus assembly protein Flp/PilA
MLPHCFQPKEIEMNKFYGALCNMHSKLVTKKDEGATMVEYGLLVALIACACIVAVTLVGTDLAAMFSFIAGKVAGAT